MNRTVPTLAALFVLFVASFACTLPNTASPTPTPTSPPESVPTLTPQPPAPTDTSAPSGVPISFAGISFTIPLGVASGAGPESVAAVSDSNGPGWDVAPAHTKFSIQNYPLQDTFLKPEIYVYPAAEYEAANNGAAISLERLRALTSGVGMDVNNDTLPYVPFFNAGQTFVAQTLLIKFQNGSGVRMVTQYDQAYIPVNNHEVIYHFQGLTNDGKYYVIAIFPIHSVNLPAEGNPDLPVPDGGVPFNQDDPAAYFDAITQVMNNAAPESFTPSLATLDALIQSLNIGAP